MARAEEKKEQAEAVLLPTEVREWTTASGLKMKFRLLAVDHEKKTVTVGRDFRKAMEMEEMPFERFSAEDQAFFSRCTTQRAGEGKDGNITLVDAEDPEMKEAIAEAVKAFPQAWKAIQMDLSLQLPELEMVMVKAAFRDPDAVDKDAENMWVMGFTYDEETKTITGKLGNPPDHLKSVKIGQKVTVPLADLRDWIYFKDGKVKGGFTEKLIHKRMSAEEKKAHNERAGVNWEEQ